MTITQQEFIDRLVMATKPACRLEGLAQGEYHPLCRTHKVCEYQEQQKGGAVYCTFQMHLLALVDAMREPEYAA